MREFWAAFSDSGNFPVNVWVVLMGLAGIVTGGAAGGPFGRLVFSPDMPALLGFASLTLLLWGVSLVPLYLLDLPMQNGWRRGGVGLVMAGSLVLTCQYGGAMAAEIEPYEWKPLGYALLFYGPNLTLGLLCMNERRDEFEPRQDTGPGVWAALWGRILGAAQGAKLPGLMSIIRRRILPAKGERV
jgi:hypothetical protein